MFFWYQVSEDDKAWVLAAASDRADVLSKVKPTYVTVLDASDEPQDGWVREDFLKMKYSGPLYFDWDAEDSSDTIKEFTSHLLKLQGMGLDLACTKLFATGGRGFHMEIPQACFMERVPKEGTTQLPYVYKEMARQFQTDTMDMRIYTGRKGRMWRTTGVKRKNGMFKVQLTPEEALEVTPESYAKLTAYPRPPLQVADPSPCLGLKPLYLQARRKVDSEVKRTKDSKKDVEALKVFGGKYPPAVVGVMRGVGYNTGAGFNQIAMQLAIVANALGRTEAQFLAECAGFIELHQGDGSRYNSPGRRQRELKEMFWYVNGDDCYAYSVGAIKNICSPDVTQADLTGVSESSDAPWDESLDTVPGEGEVPQGSDAAPNYSKYDGIKMNRQGIFRKTQEGEIQISDIAFVKPRVLKELTTGREIGFAVDVASRGHALGLISIGLDSFKSRSALDNFCATYGTNFRGTDQQAGIIRTVLSERAAKGGNVQYVVHKEGLDLVQDPTKSSFTGAETHEAAFIPVWVSEGAVFQDSADGAAPAVQFVYRPQVTKKAFVEPDIHRAKALEDTPEAREVIASILSVNEDYVVAVVLGWYISCYHRMFYHHCGKEFPLLHIVGSAGSGKSKTADLFGYLHHVVTNPKSISVGISTAHAIKTAMITSASAPVTLEEYKPSEMDPRKYNNVRQLLRLAYNAGGGATGGASDGTADFDYRNITEYSLSTPICYLAETKETQSALQQRSLIVSVRSAAHSPGAQLALLEGPAYLSRLGGAIFRSSIKETVASRKVALLKCKAEVTAAFGARTMPRIVTNAAVCLAGLDYLSQTLEPVFGDTFTLRVEQLRQAILSSGCDAMATDVMSETSKMLDCLALVSKGDPDSLDTLKEGKDYIVGDGFVEILPRDAFYKYAIWARRTNSELLFRTPEAFIFNLCRHDAVIDLDCRGSVLRTSLNQKVFRLDTERLSSEGVEDFRSRAH